MGEEGDLVARRLARGCRCFGAWLGPSIIAYGWLSAESEWIGELGLEIRPARGEAYVWNCVTVPAHRGKGLFRAVLLRMAEQLKREGLARLWIGSIDGVGEKAIEGAGFVPVLRFRGVSMGGLRCLQVSRAENAEAGLISAARGVLDLPGRQLRLSALLRRARTRRH